MNPFQFGDEIAVPAKVGSYRIEGRLGSGGMGIVYRAYDEVLQRPLAAKQVLPQRSDPLLARRLRREARAAARLNHPVIVQIYDIVETEEGDWIMMELVEGRSLDQVMRDPGLPLPQAIRLGREIAEGLSEAHSHGIIHRDLKATNLMVTRSGHAKILDFGLAKIADDASMSDLSQTGILLGTYYAMSPEQIEGLAVDHRSDLFSLGTLLYEMCTGVSPFRAGTVAETLARICNLRPVRVNQLRDDIPRDLADLIDHLLVKEAGRRPGSATEAARILGLIERMEAVSEARSEWGPAGSGQEAMGVSSGEATLFEGVLPARQLAVPALPLSAWHPGERRQMTVASCEIVGPGGVFGSLSGAFGPQVLYELMLQLRALTQRITSRYDGYLGDFSRFQFLIGFGYPQAHEEDARRAVHAVFDLLEEIVEARSASGEKAPLGLTLRAGVHTGPAVVSAGSQAAEPVTLGETLDAAIELRSLAEPGCVVVSATTSALIQKSYATAAMAPVRIPGLAEPSSPHRVLGAVDLQEDSGVGLPPVVGRGQELGLLLSRWELVREGRGQVVLISGEAGIGKSRLVLALRERLGEDTAQWQACYGSSHAQGSPLQPMIGLLRRAVTRPQGGSPLEQLERFLERFSLAEALPLFASLLEIPLEERHPALNLTPDRQREKTLEALVAMTLEMAERRPLVFVVEDVHWLDPTTLGWLDSLIDQAATVPLFLILTVRLHTMETLWGPRAHLAHITLSSLSETETESLIDRIAGGRDLPAGLRKQIVARTDGVPLFVEELTKAVLESGGSGESRELPVTLRDSLTARLDRLGTAKEVAQLASVIGRSFSLDLLAAIAPRDGATLQQELRRLIQAELIYRKGFGAQTKYYFKHALVQDAAYESLLLDERQETHLRIAELLETRFPETAESQPEVVALHYSESRHPGRAIRHWHKAGLRALVRSANPEAIRHAENALALLADEPLGAQRDEWELNLLKTVLGPAQQIAKGPAAPEVGKIYSRLQELSAEVSTPHALWGLWAHEQVRGSQKRSLELGRKLLWTAQAQDDQLFLIAGHCAVGIGQLCLNSLVEAQHHLERGLDVDIEDPTFFSPLGVMAHLVMSALSALVLWLLGFPDRALERCQAVLNRTRGTNHHFTVTGVYLLVGYTYQLCRDTVTVRHLMEELIALSQEGGVYLTREGRILLGCARATEDPEVGLALARATLTEHLDLGFKTWHTLYHSQLIENQLHYGQRQEAEAELERVFSDLIETGESYLEAELFRLKGESSLGRGDGQEAEALFRKALEISRRSSARSLELRAAMSLARLWQSQERQAEAHRLLAEIYGWFTEGFETGDLRAAQELLEELADPARS